MTNRLPEAHFDFSDSPEINYYVHFPYKKDAEMLGNLMDNLDISIIGTELRRRLNKEFRLQWLSDRVIFEVALALDQLPPANYGKFTYEVGWPEEQIEF